MLKEHNRRLILHFLLLMAMLIPIQARSATAEWCENEWKIISRENNDPLDYSKLLKTWQGLRKECAGTVAYEARLAFAYMFVKDVNQAHRVLFPFINKESKYSYLIDFAQLHSEAVAYEIDNKLDENVPELEQKYIAYVMKYPNFPDAFGMLGGYQAFLHKYDEAIKSLETGSKTEMDHTQIYRNLAICYVAVGRYDEAIEAADKAYSAGTKTLISDPEFVYAIAKADAALGDYQSAQTAIKVILAKVPEIKTTPEFIETVQFVINEIDKRKAKANLN